MKIKIAELVEDFDLYPRGDVDSTHVTHIVDAIEAKAELPPPLIDLKSHRIVDGFHRKRAWQRVLGVEGTIEVIAKPYKSERQMMLEAMRLNANHGRALSNYDRTIAIEKGRRIGLQDIEIAQVLNLVVERVAACRIERCAKHKNRFVALKASVRHFAGRELTKEQTDAMPKIGGNNALFYVNQLKLLLETDMIDWTNENLLEGLASLRDLLVQAKIEKALEEKT